MGNIFSEVFKAVSFRFIILLIFGAAVIIIGISLVAYSIFHYESTKNNQFNERQQADKKHKRLKQRKRELKTNYAINVLEAQTEQKRIELELMEQEEERLRNEREAHNIPMQNAMNGNPDIYYSNQYPPQQERFYEQPDYNAPPGMPPMQDNNYPYQNQVYNQPVYNGEQSVNNYMPNQGYSQNNFQQTPNYKPHHH